MSTKGFKIVIVVVLLLLNVVSVFKVFGNTSAGIQEKQEISRALESARKYRKNNLCNASLKYYARYMDENDSVELREEMVEVYDAALVNGEIDSQSTIDDFIMGCIDSFWKQAAIYEFALDYFEGKENVEKMVEVLERAGTNKISSDVINQKYDELSKKCGINTCRFMSVSDSADGLYCVNNGEKYGFVDSSGETVLEFVYDMATPFYDEYSIFKRNGYTYIGDKEDVRWKYLNDTISASSGLGEGFVAVKEGETYTYYDVNGGKNLGTYDYAGKFSNGLAAVRTGEQWNVIDTEGKAVSATAYSEIKCNSREECVNNQVIFVKDSTWHMMDTSMKKMNEFTCDDVDVYPTEDWFAFKRGDKWGFADYNGEVKIEPQYEEARAFSNGYAGVKKDGKWGFIDHDNQYQMQGDYQDVMYFTEQQTCFVKIDDLWTIIYKLI